MKKYTEIIKESSDSNMVQIGHIKTTNSEVSKLNNMIDRYVTSVYKPFGFVKGQEVDIDVDGKIINGEYIGKMINNRNVYKNISLFAGVDSFDELFNFISKNLYNFYHYKGKHFETTLKLLMETTRRGDIGERMSKTFFTNYIKTNKNINIVLEDPTVKEDMEGIDGKFKLNGKEYTIQVKPYTNYKVEGEIIYVKSEGAMKVDTNYLILYNLVEKRVLIFRNPKGRKSIFQTSGDVFVIPIKNIVNEL